MTPGFSLCIICVKKMKSFNKRLINWKLIKKSNGLTVILLLFLVIVVSGCATVPKNEHGMEESNDPHENVNRISYDFTDAIDRMVLEPVANVYADYVPNAAQRSIGNFYENWAYPNTFINAFLQGKFRQGLEDTLRFAINSTIGLFGLFDMATHMGLPENKEDFGQTLAVWGVDISQPYVFIPILGPSNYRDMTGIPVTVATNILFYAGTIAGAAVLGPLVIVGAIDKRARMADPMRFRDQAALDPYIFVREAFTQQREYLIYDGAPPLDIYSDLEQEEDIQLNALDENKCKDFKACQEDFIKQ
jgi:phospholipid-binding lipoprotein MlaA